LDELCRTLYDTETGISTYIEMMSTVFPRYSGKIQCWREDFRQLERMRRIRNELAHTVDAFDTVACTQEDLQWATAFYRRILDRDDPLAQLRRLFRSPTND